MVIGVTTSTSSCGDIGCLAGEGKLADPGKPAQAQSAKAPLTSFWTVKKSRPAQPHPRFGPSGAFWCSCGAGERIPYWMGPLAAEGYVGIRLLLLGSHKVHVDLLLGRFCIKTTSTIHLL